MSNPLGSYATLLARQESLCQTARAPDYYGLGIRLGIYFSWWQAYLANTLLSEEIAGAADTNMMFLLVVLVAMIKCTSVRMLEQIDGLILMHLSGGFLFGTLTLWGYRTRRYLEGGPKEGIRFFGGFGTHSRLVVTTAVSVYGLWFWMHGITSGTTLVAIGSEGEVGELEVDPPNSPDCSTLYTFMFAKVRADGGIRIFYILVCVCCSIYFGTMLLASSVAGWARASKMVRLAREQKWAETSRLRFATGFNQRELELIFKATRVLSAVWIVFSMVLVECTLNFNNMNSVLGGPHNNELHLPAQLLPLLIGAFGFVRICYLVFESWRSPGGDVEPSLSRPATPLPARTMHG